MAVEYPAISPSRPILRQIKKPTQHLMVQSQRKAEGVSCQSREAKTSQSRRSVREPDRNGAANRTFLLNRLAMTERHIAVREHHIARQREIVAELGRVIVVAIPKRVRWQRNFCSRLK
jgi:hypothetical protein